ncbi:MAG: hypothetical protein WA639_03725 [Candidatus Acidiferrum sp.]
MNSSPIIQKSREGGKRVPAMLDPGSRGQIRRARDTTPANRRETPNMKSNGHDPSAGKVNGHGPAPPSRTAQEMEAPLDMGRAASDDARDFPAAAGAASAPAGKERDACAEVAPPPEGKAKRQRGTRRNHAGSGTSRVLSEVVEKTEKGNKKTKEKQNMVNIPRGSERLPDTGAGFVDTMHEHVDLYIACARLVKSKDEKIAQRMAERLLEMKYGKGPSATAEESSEIVIDIDSAVARRAAMGDKQ